MNDHDVLIVGGGHAGAQCASALRQFGFSGSVGLLTDELALPYERPPLSKDYLSGEKTREQLAFHPPEFWADKAIDVRQGQRVEAIDATRREVRCVGGGVYRYGSLVWAAGGEARRLSCTGGDLAGVHVVRTIADVDRIRHELADVQRVVVIGGGFIGLESAASLSKIGKPVTVVEAFERVLARVTGPHLSGFIEREHRAHGVEICVNARIEALEGERARVGGVRLQDGRLLAAELVIAGIGIEPAVAALQAAGARGQSGVDVDAQCRTSLDHVYAIGDCARQAHAFAGNQMIRLESVQNAVDQATLVASVLTGRPLPTKSSVPWFWSMQYDLRLQMAGLSSGYDDVVVRGDPASRAFSIAYLRDGVLIAIDAINAVKDFVQGRAAIGKGVRPDRAALADPSIALSTL
ncbi:NAD(P)/FAD-dependent oxidoreductase [Paraburkholderia sp. J67]|uniref:NAD(P)/FAD-dependent oxidoreductase n=1 Tax=Paraburkholderia sp. J67 TaxID=2805435 RepID=UPI002ABDFE54|nr:FAD-dependent oxidoreductase [Paraburkholderia sp. J67]